MGWSISTNPGRPNSNFGFSPLRYWGGLYPKRTAEESKTLSFSPLRYWGGLYQFVNSTLFNHEVLVPFDIGVVYIINKLSSDKSIKF